MNKTALIKRLGEANPHLIRSDIQTIVATIFEEIADALSRGDRVELRGFGAFTVRKRDAHISRNRRTGDKVAVSEKHVPFFKTGKILRNRLETS